MIKDMDTTTTPPGSFDRRLPPGAWAAATSEHQRAEADLALLLARLDTPGVLEAEQAQREEAYDREEEAARDLLRFRDVWNNSPARSTISRNLFACGCPVSIVVDCGHQEGCAGVPARRPGRTT